MKKTFVALFCAINTIVNASYAEVKAAISYFPVVIGKDMPDAAKQSLTAKMSRIIADNGYGSEEQPDRFVMLAKCYVIEKDVTPTTPPRISQTVEITFVIGDVIEDKTFASTSFELKGIGINETKAWQTAVNGLKPANPQIREMFSQASGKIEDYYAANCKNIIAQAKSLAGMGEDERAIYL